MDMLFVPKPLFNARMETEAYYFSFCFGNVLIERAKQSNIFDRAANVPLLEFAGEAGLEALTFDRPIFVPISTIALFTDVENTCKVPRDKVAFIIDNDVELTAAVMERVTRLRSLGFKVAAKRDREPQSYANLLALCDYVFFGNAASADFVKNLNFVRAAYRNVVVIATGLNSMEQFDSLKSSHAKLFDGTFYKAQQGGKNAGSLAPLKIHYVQLLNIIGQEDFDFAPFAKIVQQDPALAIKFMRLVNSNRHISNKITSLAQAAAMLGQKEIRKWITTAVSSEMNVDKPGEVARVSLLRAKFCENMARHFELAVQAENLFLMGLFSVLDVMLEMQMADALKYVFVPDKIKDALLERKGQYAELYALMLAHDAGDWQEVSRIALVKNVSVADISKAYELSLYWLRDFLTAADDDEEIVVQP